MPIDSYRTEHQSSYNALQGCSKCKTRSALMLREAMAVTAMEMRPSSIKKNTQPTYPPSIRSLTTLGTEARATRFALNFKVVMLASIRIDQKGTQSQRAHDMTSSGLQMERFTKQGPHDESLALGYVDQGERVQEKAVYLAHLEKELKE